MAKEDIKWDKEGKRSRSNYVLEVERRARVESQTQLRSLSPSQPPHSLVRCKSCHYCNTVVPFAVSFNCPIEGHVFCEKHLCLTIGNDDISVSTKRYQATVPSSLNYCPICSLQCQCSICKKDMNKATIELRRRENVQKKKYTSVYMKVLSYLHKDRRAGDKKSPSPSSPSTPVRPGRRRRNTTTTNDDDDDSDNKNNNVKNKNTPPVKKRTRRSNGNNNTNDSSSDDDNNGSSPAVNRRSSRHGNNNKNNSSHSSSDDDDKKKKDDANPNTTNNTTLPSKLTYPHFVRSHLELFFTFMPGRDGSEVFRRLNDAWRHHVEIFGDNCGDKCDCLQQDRRNEILKFLVPS